MPRTTVEAVEAIIEVDELILDIEPFIEAANSLVTRICVKDDSDYSDADLELIERWLSAHFYAIRDPRLTEEGAGSVRARYESKVDLGFNLTRYGQQALLLDTEGGLAKLQNEILKGGRKNVKMVWLGTDPCERD